jgi:PPOX class probable F420-dependent enzyme
LPTLSSGEARTRFHAARIARLATVAHDGTPHLVPLVFAPVGDDRLVSAVDHKPKRTASLRRLANIVLNPRVCLLADQYDEDWTQLWWARADGTARVLNPDDPESVHPVDVLMERYGQYRDRRPAGPVILVEVTRWSGWHG